MGCAAGGEHRRQPDRGNGNDVERRIAQALMEGEATEALVDPARVTDVPCRGRELRDDSRRPAKGMSVLAGKERALIAAGRESVQACPDYVVFLSCCHHEGHSDASHLELAGKREQWDHITSGPERPEDCSHGPTRLSRVTR